MFLEGRTTPSSERFHWSRWRRSRIQVWAGEEEAPARDAAGHGRLRVPLSIFFFVEEVEVHRPSVWSRPPAEKETSRAESDLWPERCSALVLITNERKKPQTDWLSRFCDS